MKGLGFIFYASPEEVLRLAQACAAPEARERLLATIRDLGETNPAEAIDQRPMIEEPVPRAALLPTL